MIKSYLLYHSKTILWRKSHTSASLSIVVTCAAICPTGLSAAYGRIGDYVTSTPTKANKAIPIRRQYRLPDRRTLRTARTADTQYWLADIAFRGTFASATIGLMCLLLSLLAASFGS